MTSGSHRKGHPSLPVDLGLSEQHFLCKARQDGQREASCEQHRLLQAPGLRPAHRYESRGAAGTERGNSSGCAHSVPALPDSHWVCARDFLQAYALLHEVQSTIKLQVHVQARSASDSGRKRKFRKPLMPPTATDARHQELILVTRAGSHPLLLKPSNKAWKEQLAFLTQLNAHLNQLNLQLPGKDQPVMDLCSAAHRLQPWALI